MSFLMINTFDYSAFGLVLAGFTIVLVISATVSERQKVKSEKRAGIRMCLI